MDKQQHRITDKKVDQLRKRPPSSGNLIEWDKEIKGFGVRITAGEAVAFVLSYRNKEGKKHRYTIGRYPEMLSDAARDEATELKKGIRNGIDPLEQKKKLNEAPPSLDGAEPTFKVLTVRYLEEWAVYKKPHSIRDDKLKINGILSQLNDRAITSITQDEVEKLKLDLQATPYQANRTLALLSKMFKLAVKWKYRPDNPVYGVKKFPEHPRHVYLKQEQVAALKKALDQYEYQNTADVIRLLLLTGAREGEALKADWSEFDLKLGVWNKPRRHMKGNKEHHLPLGEDALGLLHKMKPKKKGPLFPAGLGASEKHRVTIRRPWIQICKAAGLVTAVEKTGKRRHKVIRYKPNFHIHDLRHTYGSWLVQDGVPIYDVKELLGHAQVATTERFYGHHDDKSLRKATNVFGGLFREAEAKQ
jgi:integrase